VDDESAHALIMPSAAFVPSHPRASSLSMPDFDLDAFVATGMPQIPKTPRLPANQGGTSDAMKMDNNNNNNKDKFNKSHFTTNDMKTFEDDSVVAPKSNKGNENEPVNGSFCALCFIDFFFVCLFYVVLWYFVFIRSGFLCFQLPLFSTFYVFDSTRFHSLVSHS
jgi:hypothetical protein